MSAGKTLSENHPDEIELMAYLETPGSDAVRDVHRHLIGCARCRKEVAGFQRVIGAMERYPTVEVEAPPGNHPDELAMADYVEKRLDPPCLSEIKEHIKGCAYCMKAALYYTLESAGTERPPLLKTAPTPAKSDFKKSEKKPDRSWRIPVWLEIPVIALATAALFLLVFFGKKSGPMVASYQDRAEVIFTPLQGSDPGIGFFGGASEKTEVFDGLSLYLENPQHLRAKWSNIKNAHLYELRIYSSSSEGRSLVGQASTTGTEVVVQVSGMMPGKRYEWELSGNTSEDLRFLARGGFVVGQS